MNAFDASSAAYCPECNVVHSGKRAGQYCMTPRKGICHKRLIAFPDRSRAPRRATTFNVLGPILAGDVSGSVLIIGLRSGERFGCARAGIQIAGLWLLASDAVRYVPRMYDGTTGPDELHHVKHHVQIRLDDIAWVQVVAEEAQS